MDVIFMDFSDFTDVPSETAAKVKLLNSGKYQRSDISMPLRKDSY